MSDLSGDEVSVTASSGASIDAAGTCTRLDADSSSGASLDVRRLECADVRVAASSGGSAAVFARTSVDLDASSGGSVDVAGGPNDRDINTSSGGSVDFD